MEGPPVVNEELVDEGERYGGALPTSLIAVCMKEPSTLFSMPIHVSCLQHNFFSAPG